MARDACVPRAATYDASKAAVTSFTEAIHVQILSDLTSPALRQQEEAELASAQPSRDN